MTIKTRPGKGRTSPQSNFQYSPAREFIHRPSSVVFLVISAIIIVVCIIGPWLGQSPDETSFEAFAAPSWDHLAGTDDLGRDFFARLMAGGRVSLLVGVFVALGCLTIAVIVGGLAGFFGGVADVILSRVSDFFQVVPSIILAMVAIAILGSNLPLIIIVLSLTHWPQVARIIRAECMRIRTLGFVESQIAAGFPRMRIFLSDVLPNAFPPLLVATTMTIGRAILAESALSFLGLGDANTPSWGALLFNAQSFIGIAWWLAILPGAAIFLVVLAANVLGDNLNDSLNPNLSRVK